MKDVLIISHFIFLKNEKGNCRFGYIAEAIADSANVEIVSSSFCHEEKKQRDLNVPLNTDYKITLLPEPGYPKNVCLKRLRSHKKFAKNLERYLKSRKIPDVVYCAVPSLDAAYIAAKYCKKNNVKFIIDIQDLWPEAFQMVFNIPIISNVLFAPMKRKANKIYAQADEIIAVSQTYLNRAFSVSRKDVFGKVVYLGTDKFIFDKHKEREVSPDNYSQDLSPLINVLCHNDRKAIYLAYAGTLGSSYDLNTVFAAMRLLEKNVLQNVKVVIMGDGPKRKEFEESAAGLPVIFTGALAYCDMVWILSRCDIALNPIKKGAAQSIINKHMDYAMAGLPVISTQECLEYRELLNKYNCGINCECENSREVAAAIELMYNNQDLRKQMGEQSRIMGIENFDRVSTYMDIVDTINNI